MFATRPEIFIHKTCNKLPSGVKRGCDWGQNAAPPYGGRGEEGGVDLGKTDSWLHCFHSSKGKLPYFKINFYCPFLGLVGASCYELSFLNRRLAS